MQITNLLSLFARQKMKISVNAWQDLETLFTHEYNLMKNNRLTIEFDFLIDIAKVEK